MNSTEKDIYFSPLRYPGGKGILASFIENLLGFNNINNGTYCEVYAGGAGAAIKLLLTEKVKRIILNDADYHIYAFWSTILNFTEAFILKLEDIHINIEEWQIQKNIYNNPSAFSIFDVGFSTFFLNRTNRGGVLPNAGPIGGFDQSGNYKMDARFNKSKLITRIEKIKEKGSFIEIYNQDAVEFLNNFVTNLNPNDTLIYLDPPYYVQGRNLYFSYYDKSDHLKIAECLKGFKDYYWFISYDNVLEINEMYNEYRLVQFNLNYSLQSVYKGNELIAFSPRFHLPDGLKIGNQSLNLV